MMKKRILIIENHPDNGRFLADHFNYAGYEAIWVESGNRVIDICRAGLPDFIILEMRVEGSDGKTMLETIKADPNLKELPLIYMSADIRQHQIDWAKAMGASAVMAKPCSNKMLESLIETFDKATVESAIGRAA
jgi:CheY-like chemotaxis protein